MKLVGLNCPSCDRPDVGFLPPCWLICECGVHPADQKGLWIIPGEGGDIMVYPCSGPSENIEIIGPPRVWGDQTSLLNVHEEEK